jgi:hypothetical protein
VGRLWLKKLEIMAKEKQYYCAGFYWYGSDLENQLPRFLKQGIWENGFDDKYLDKVKYVPVGSEIAAKTTYTKKIENKTISVLGIQAIGTVTGNPGDGKTLKVKWRDNFEPFTLDGRGAYRSTISKVSSKENIELIFGNKLRRESDALAFDEHDLQSDFPLNQILYGPPVTGKTYSTIAKAVAIIDGIKEEALETRVGERADIKERFEELKDSGQIVFCTFHQSMSYEDFIEGIKPILIEEEIEENLGYKIEDGIFKRLCTIAKYDFYKSGFAKASKNISRAELFNVSYNELLSEIEEKLDKQEDAPLESKTGLNLFVTQITNNLNLKVKHEDAQREKPYTVSKQRLLKLFNHFKSLDEIRNVHKDIRGVIGGANTTAYWAVLSSLFRIYDSVVKKGGVLNEVKELGQNYETIKSIVNSFPITKEKLNETASEKYVIIIDEINRGNVSQIFGELITLIEEDKRLGKSEALEVVLPYSKEKFGIPPSLHIIGTMNTADRSVEALDTALRRRFSFEEITPKPFLLENMEMDGLSLELILETINKRIEKLLDRDHQIGHSYFLSVKNLDDLKAVFRNKINPLLQEYFFGDYGKIGLILGSGFVSLDKQGTENLFADFAYPDDYSILEKPVYRLKDISQMDDSAFKEAVRILLNSAIA